MIQRIILLTVLSGLFACSGQKSTDDERSPESSLADLKVYDGLKVELFASEPMFSNPTNIAVDARGRVWVCEAYNYRNALNPKNPVRAEGDRIVILEDTDGDGKADVSKVFYQGTDVNAALGISVLGNKIYVSCSPNVFVFTDSNGDDVPDSKEVLFTGIQGEQHDHGMHTFTFGHDGRLYFNMGNAGQVLLTAQGDTIRDIHGRKVVTNGKPFREGLALRCERDGSNVEVLGHNFRNNYELTQDPYGNIWQSDNDDDGNKGTRINYVMEQGNYGYLDELTGAGWYTRRTNIEKEIPLRHWHLNDPGVVPNVLQTGSGSPAGITMYEGTGLPEIFQGQVIHAEAGHNVVRAYPMEHDGAGFKGSIVNLLEGQKDQWFRPIDVTPGPDGSLFVADWYDPGVGGHQAGDLNRGRIYRITKKEGVADSDRDIDFTRQDADAAARALTNPNTDLRYRAWIRLSNMKEEAEPALQKLWTSANPRHRAQALWLLARLDGIRDKYFTEAVMDPDANIRITAIRAARQHNFRVQEIAEKLAKDPSSHVRREVILALRNNPWPEAAALWSTLARQHSAGDRWYLEALGIAAEGNWDLYFATWKKGGVNINDAAARDIIWRSRSREAIPLLGQIVKGSNEQEMLRYFRAFDFHRDPSKQNVLASLVANSEDEKLLYALKHMDATAFKMTPVVKTKLDRVMARYRGQLEFVELAGTFALREKSDELITMALQYPDSASGKEAARLLLDWNRVDLIEAKFNEGDALNSQALVKALWPHISRKTTQEVMEKLMMDSTNDLEVRKLAVRTFGGPWSSEDRLLALAKDNKIPDDLRITAAGVFQTAWRANIREDGAKYLQLPTNNNARQLPPVAVLAEREGDAAKGTRVFQNICANCHEVNGNGEGFGPDLGEIGDKLSKEAMLTSILFPDEGISFGYEAWRIGLRDGTTAFGRIISETEEVITVQYLKNIQEIKKPDVVSRVKMENSLMPSNLQSTISEEELVDLVTYLTTLKKPASVSMN